jgi:hypothetical protein
MNIGLYNITHSQGYTTVNWRSFQGMQSIIIPLDSLIEQYINHIIELKRLCTLAIQDQDAFLKDDMGFKISVYFAGMSDDMNTYQAIIEAYNQIFHTNFTIKDLS